MHVALSVDVDRFDDRYLRKTYCKPGCGITINGKVPTVAELRAACAEMRAMGFEVFPPCDSHDKRGFCKGHVEAGK